MASTSSQSFAIPIPEQNGRQPGQAHSDDLSPQLGSVRRHRSELKRAMTELEGALAQPVGADAGAWLHSVRGCVNNLRSAFDNHIRVHEGPDSFHADIVRSQPHLASRVVALQRDHYRLSMQLLSLSELVEDRRPPSDSADDVRVLGTDLIHRFARHRQRGADVVWEAFNYDVGGEH